MFISTFLGATKMNRPNDIMNTLNKITILVNVIFITKSKVKGSDIINHLRIG